MADEPLYPSKPGKSRNHLTSGRISVEFLSGYYGEKLCDPNKNTLSVCKIFLYVSYILVYNKKAGTAFVPVISEILEDKHMNIEQLRKDMVAAMKAKDKPRKEAISSLISAVKKAGIDAGCREDIPEEIVDRVILKEQKTVKEQIVTCPDSRKDLKAEYQFRYDVISEYAPQLMSADEIKTYILEKFAEVAASKNKGQIMKAVMGDLKGKADGSVINQVVGDLCK